MELRYLDPRLVMSIRDILNVLQTHGASMGEAYQAVTDTLNERPGIQANLTRRRTVRGVRRLSQRGRTASSSYTYVISATWGDDRQPLTQTELFDDTFLRLSDVLGYLDQGALDANVRLRQRDPSL